MFYNPFKLISSLCIAFLLTACATTNIDHNTEQNNLYAGYDALDFSPIKSQSDIIAIRQQYLNDENFEEYQRLNTEAAASVYEHSFGNTDWSKTVQPAIKALKSNPAHMYSHYALMNHYSNTGEHSKADEHERVLSLIILTIKDSGEGDIYTPYATTDMDETLAFLDIIQAEEIGRRILPHSDGYIFNESLIINEKTGELESLYFKLIAPTVIANKLASSNNDDALMYYRAIIQSAAAYQDPGALVGAAFLKSSALIQSRDIEKAKELYKIAREQDNIFAETGYAQLLISTLDGLTDKEKELQIDEAADILLNAAEIGYAEAYTYLFALYVTLRPNEVENQVLTNLLETASQKGSSRASLMLSQCYQTGLYVNNIDIEKTIHYLNIAAEQHSFPAKAQYANIVLRNGAKYWDKKGKAKEYLAEAVDKNYPAAMAVAYDLHRLELVKLKDLSKYKKQLIQAVSKTNTIKEFNQIIWILTTAKEDEIRDEEKAIFLGNNIMNNIAGARNNPYLLHTLSVAYANDNNFDKAIQLIETAIFNFENGPTVNNYGAIAVKFDEHLELYKSGRSLTANDFINL